METRTLQLIVMLALLALSTLNSQLSTAHAQGTTFTYQGRVTDNGTNFTGTGQFKFALVTSSNANLTATATANAPSGGFITGYVVTSGGKGYVTAPTVAVFGGGGSGAAAHANISGGAVTSLTVDNTGNGGYSSAPTVLIAPPPANLSYVTYWSNDGTSVNGSEPSAAVDVTVNGGLFTEVLGDTSQPNMTGLSASLFTQPNLQIRIWFNDGVNSFAALDPVQNLTPAPYAVTATKLLGGFTVLANNTNGSPNVIGGSSINYVSSGVIGATIAGGGVVLDPYDYLPFTNSVTANFGTVSGGIGNTVSNVAATVGGGAQNTAGGSTATVGGGFQNTASGNSATVPGGQNNTASGYGTTIAGGGYNSANANNSTVGGGEANSAAGQDSTVSGGTNNTASGNYSSVSGGSINTANTLYATVSGGNANLANGQYSIVAGGHANTASGDFSFAGGNHANAPYQGDFVWADDNGGNFAATANNQFYVRAGGGVFFYSGSGSTGVQLASGSGSWSSLSDRNAKENFQPVDAQTVLTAVAAMPMTTWNYKTQAKTIRHVGPMAQDFAAAFHVGENNTTISTVDEGGVALAAIQGLNEKLEVQLNKKDTEIEELKSRLEKLEQLMNTKTEETN